VSPEIAAWLAVVVFLGLSAFVEGVRFNTLHSRRYAMFMSDAHRFDLFLTRPKEAFRRAIPDNIARSRALLSHADDPAVERLRRRTIGLGVLTAAVATTGLPVEWILLGVARRMPSIEAEEWAIVLFWAVLLIIAAVRRANRLSLVLLGAALTASVVVGYVSGLS
jgi:hypothetical protein